MDFEEPMEDSPLCIVCGWRRPAVPPEIQQEVKAYLGKNTNRSRYIRKRIGTVKPPLSGWEKEKRRRELEKRRQRAGTG